MSQRYFRTDNADVYESVRLQLDEAWGHPTPDGGTLTCFDPAATAPRDIEDRILLAVSEEFVTWEPAASLLPSLIGSGEVEEISQAEYVPVASVLPDPQP
jgi:hypothetical protein